MKLTHHIKNILGIYKRACIFASSLLLLATSCTDDDIPFGDDLQGPNSSIGAVKGDALAFTVSLPTMQTSTRAINYPGSEIDETYEDYVDPDRLMVFFLDEEGYVIKILKTWDETETKAYTLVPIEDYENRDYKNYYFRLSFTELQEEGKGGDALAKFLRENPFKIAVLANVDINKAQNINIQEVALSMEEDGSLIIGDKENKNHINVLHHQTTATDNEPYIENADKTSTYKFLYNGSPYNINGKVLGHFSDWVKNLDTEIEDEESARAWIRKNWDPSTDKEKNQSPNFQDYSYLWSLWNFGGSATDNRVPYGTSETDYKMDKDFDFEGKWNTRNGEDLRKWISKFGNEQSITENLEKTKDNYTPPPATATEEDIKSHYKEKNPLYFRTIDGAKAIDNEGFYGVKLPPITPQNGERIDESNPQDKGFFSFTAYATGTLFITAKNSGNENKNSVKIIAQKGYSKDTQSYTFRYYKVDENNKTIEPKEEIGVQTIGKRISITQNSQEVYIYNAGEQTNDIEIYQIEYIEDKYLYDTNRKGVNLSVDNQPIPMYGVQSFPALKSFWEEGTLFDLTNFNGLTDDDFITNNHASVVPLLRSVAKIEVRIPRSMKINQNHVYLRSSNRTARWEPLNVVTNTFEIWKDHMIDYAGQHSKECEWFSIRYHTPFFDSDTQNNPAGQVEEYKKKLAWYYGDWKTWNTTNEFKNLVPELLDNCGDDETSLRGGWDHNVYHSKPHEDESVDNPGYPRVMNAMINRSDFVKFIYAGIDGIYDRYILYTGDKFVDDPNDVGAGSDSTPKHMISGDPKVCHIEFRTEEDPLDNVDDNNCYRIYFIEKGFNQKMQIPNLSNNAHTWEEMYEQSKSNLREHWPIMRNHYYSFTVLDIDQRMAIVRLEVLPWRKVDDITISW